MKKMATLLIIICAFIVFPAVAMAESGGLAEKEKIMTLGLVISISISIVILLLLFCILVRDHRRLKIFKNETDNFSALRKTFIDADDRLVYLKDENLKYVFVNRALVHYYQKPAEEIIGHDDYALLGDAFSQGNRTDLAALEKETLVVGEEEWDGRTYKTTKFPIRMLNGRFGVGAYITDITEAREHERQREKVLQRNMILADVLTRSFQSRQEQLDYVLHQSLELTESQYGYIYLYDEEAKEFTLNSWTKGVMEACDVTEKMSIYQLAGTGIWGEVVRQRKPILVNDFEQPNPLKRGYPEGHVALKKFMSIPVVIDGKITAVVGLANKKHDYDGNDVYEMTLLMSSVWNAWARREAQEKLSLERNMYLQTLISIGDGVMVVDKNRQVEMLNPVAEKLTGWSIAEAYGNPYRDIFVISHEQEGYTIDDPIEGVFATDRIQELGNHAILTARDGRKYALEDSAAPIKDDKNATVGVVLVFRDATVKKKQRKTIEYLSFHDALTGLYNRRFFEEELHRLDIERNLPLSIVMGDVNGLKLTNDIFGHICGDILLKKVADVLRHVCRVDDVIARWGGDEYVLLLPETDLAEADRLIGRIREEFAKEQIKAIKGSISMGADTKQNMAEDITQILNSAEEKMYTAKTLERDAVRNNAINAIIKTLHENSAREKEHSIHVSALCQEMGEALQLPMVEIRKLRDAGYLHDVGKIVLDAKILNINHRLTDEEWNEIKKHAIVGYRILNSFDQTLDLADAVLAHHERWDGTGYPKGLKGEEIPLPARIIAVAESYDRMIHDSDNNKAMNQDEAIRIFRENAGTQFDPRLAELLVQMIEVKAAKG